MATWNKPSPINTSASNIMGFQRQYGKTISNSPSTQPETTRLPPANQDDLVLHNAIIRNDKEELKRLLSTHDSNQINKTDNKGRTCLLLACELDNAEIVDILIQQRGIYLMVTDLRNWTSLHYAISKGNMPLCKILLEKRVRTDMATHDGNNSLHFLANFTNSDDPLYESIFKKVLENTKIIDAQNAYGETPLHIACLRGNETAVKLLLDSKASIAIKNRNNETCLHCAVKIGSVPITKRLLQLGANQSIVSVEGKCKEIASFYRHQEICQILEDDIKAKTDVFNLSELPKAPSTPPVMAWKKTTVQKK